MPKTLNRVGFLLYFYIMFLSNKEMKALTLQEKLEWLVNGLYQADRTTMMFHLSNQDFSKLSKRDKEKFVENLEAYAEQLMLISSYIKD